MIISVIIFVLTLLTLVVIHEFGHFIMAKRFGVKVLEFGFGIPPRIWGKKVGETLVSINWLPIGGFVQLLGEDEVGSLGANRGGSTGRDFREKPVGQRIIIVVAGVVMNLVLAWMLYYIVVGAQGFKVQVPLLTSHTFVGAQQTTKSFIFISNVSSGSPAEAAGLQAGERIVALNGNAIENSNEVIEQIKQLAGQEVTLKISRPQIGEEREVKITPRLNPPAGQGALGVGLFPANVAILEYKTPMQKLFSGPVHAWNMVAYTGEIFGRLISRSFAEKTLEPVSGSVAGPVGITAIANDILSTRNPIIPYLEFVALLSLNLAIFNLLPFPALDGGRLFFLVIEAVTRKKVHAEFEKWVHTIGMVLLLTLALLITVSDIKKIWF